MFQAQNPATGELWDEFEELTEDELEAKLDLADQTFRTYRTTSLEDRARWLYRAADVLEAQREVLAKLMVR